MEHADCLDALDRLPHRSVDIVITDPPYGLSFQQAAWDGSDIARAARRATGADPMSAGEALQAFTMAWATRCRRVLKPGGHVLAFGAPRMAHRLACGLEDGGLEIRDALMWLYGQGMPKSRRLPGGTGTALKPAYEPIILARVPLDGTTQRNLDVHGTGALNIDACRVDGRWPANVLLTHADDCDHDRCAVDCPRSSIDARAARPVSRALYCAKASHREREAGCGELSVCTRDLFPNAGSSGQRPRPVRNAHSTVKPLAVMRWLVRLACPPGGLVLDCFCGSGTTGAAAVLEQRRFIGIEQDADYAAIARARIAHWATTCHDDQVAHRPFATRPTAAR